MPAEYNVSEETRIRKILESWAAMFLQGHAGKAELKSAVLPIQNNGGQDFVELSAYAAKIPIAILGKNAAGSFENVTNAVGYSLTPATDIDNILLSSDGLDLGFVAANYKIQDKLTGIGSTVQWNANVYSACRIFYVDDQDIINYDMVTFTTAAGVTEYTNSALNGMVIAFLIFGSQILDSSQYTHVGNKITFDIGEPIQAGIKVVIIPV